uniref:Uncharacterized protein n=1 Tax=Oryza brachyantha TaxID=4533 RepID=J3MZ70_ORYBR
MCGSLLSATVLIIRFRKNLDFFSKKKKLSRTFFFNEIEYFYAKRSALKSTFFPSFQNYYKYQLIECLDSWSYHVISLGFTL